MKRPAASAAEHWESVYASKDDAGLSWMQIEPSLSLRLISEVCSAGRVIDIGGGTSPLAARLVEHGYSVAVLDISQTAIRRSRERLGARASELRWIAADVTANPDLGTFDVWHDRAVFHFLITQTGRSAYRDLMAGTLPSGGHAVIATFALEGPTKCSGLEVCRYSAESLAAELGGQFQLLKSVPESHLTPWGKPQAFQYSVFKRV
jgi:SAM-dependent methyltransferase